MANTGQDWDAAWTEIDAAIALTTGGTVQDTSAAQSNDLKSACEISIDTDYSNHAQATGGLLVYIFRDINGTDYETFGDGGWAFEMPFTQNGTNRRSFAVPTDITSSFKIGLEWLNTTGSSVATTRTAIRQADIPLAS
jgi:hypothetical protein